MLDAIMGCWWCWQLNIDVAIVVVGRIQGRQCCQENIVDGGGCFGRAGILTVGG